MIGSIIKIKIIWFLLFFAYISTYIWYVVLIFSATILSVTGANFNGNTEFHSKIEIKIFLDTAERGRA